METNVESKLALAELIFDNVIQITDKLILVVSNSKHIFKDIALIAIKNNEILYRWSAAYVNDVHGFLIIGLIENNKGYDIIHLETKQSLIDIIAKDNQSKITDYAIYITKCYIYH